MSKKSTGFTINQNQFGFVMSMLDQYVNPFAAVLREYTSNACDAVNGMPNGYVKIILPDVNDANPELIIQDNGIGMSEDFILNTLNSYATSTKRNDGESIGEKGIGSKSAFSLTSVFTIESIKDGVRTVAVNNKNTGTLETETFTTNEPNGTRVIIPVKQSDAQEIIDNANDTLNGFDSSVVHVFNADGTEHNDINWIDRIPNLIPITDSFILNPNSNCDEWKVIQGGVIYDLPSGLLLKASSNLYEDYIYKRSWKGIMSETFGFKSSYYSLPRKYIMIVPPNSFNMNPSRENIIINDHNRDVIIDFMKTVYSAFRNDADSPDFNYYDAVDFENAVIDRIQSVTSNPVYNELTWKQAYDLYKSINYTFPCLNNESLKIGDHDFHPQMRITPNKETAVFMNRNMNNPRSTYVRKTARIGTYDGLPTVYKHDMLFLTGMPADTDVNKIIRQRNMFMDEKGIERTDIGYIIISNGNPIESLDYWDAKRPHLKEIKWDDYNAVMESRKARLKAERASKPREHVSGKVTYLYSYHGGYRKTTCAFDELLNERSTGTIVIKMEKDEFNSMTTEKFNDTSLKIGIAVNGTDNDPSNLIIVRIDGSKALQERIKTECNDLNDYDYHANANKLIMKYSNELIQYDEIRIKRELLNDYTLSTYSFNIGTIFTKLNDYKNDIESVETQHMIKSLADATDDILSNTDANHESANITRKIMKLISIGGKPYYDDSLEFRVKETVESIRRYENKYQMMQLVDINGIRHNDDKMNAIINYINLMDSMNA